MADWNQCPVDEIVIEHWNPETIEGEWADWSTKWQKVERRRRERSETFEKLTRIDGIYLTEDSIPVRTLFVPRVSPEDLEFQNLLQQIKLLLSDTGSIPEDVVLVNFRSNAAFLTFTEPQKATKILDGRQMFSLRIVAADSWHQPRRRLIVPEENSIPIDPTQSMLRLNDDVLLETVAYLNLKDLISFSLVCVRFHHIVREHFKRLAHLEVNTTVTIMEFKDMIEMFGENIRSMRLIRSNFVSPPGEIIWQIVEHNCPNLDAIRLEEFAFIPVRSRIRRLLRRLKTIELVNCRLHHSFTQMFQSSWQVEKIELTGSYEITGAHIERLFSLRELHFNNCPNLQPKHLSTIIQANEKVRVLKIVSCNRLTTAFLHELPEFLADLEELRVEFYQRTQLVSAEDKLQITRLPKLKRLHLEYLRTGGIDEMLLKLSERNALRKLNISCRVIHEATVRALIACTNLQVLHLNRTNVDDATLHALSQRLTLRELHLIRCEKVTDEGLRSTIAEQRHLTLIDVSRSVKQFEGWLENVVTTLNRSVTPRPMLVVWFTDADPVSEETMNLLKRNWNLLRVRFSVQRESSEQLKYFQENPDSEFSETSDDELDLCSDDGYVL